MEHLLNILFGDDEAITVRDPKSLFRVHSDFIKREHYKSFRAKAKLLKLI